MAGSKTSNIFSVLSCASATLLMFLSILHVVVPKAQARDNMAIAEEAKCFTFLAHVPGYKDYCNSLLEPSSPPPSPSTEKGNQWGQDLEQCWASLKTIKGCVGNIFYALFHGDFSEIGHECCEEVEFIAIECLLMMFPWNPTFPSMLISYCEKH